MSSQDQTRHSLAILIVDDDLDTVTSLAEMLGLYGHTTRAALSGQEALRQVAADPPDVILLDIRMPRLDGCKVAELVRTGSVTSGKRPFLVALTGCGTETDRLRSEHAGFDLHLVKPVEPKVLIGVLERFRRLLAPPIPATELAPPSEDPPDGSSALVWRRERFFDSCESIPLRSAKRDL